jgi:plasmid maintenance system antidote protein VapI
VAAQGEAARQPRTAVLRAHDFGASLQVIAEVLGVHRSYVHQIVQGRARITS